MMEDQLDYTGEEIRAMRLTLQLRQDQLASSLGVQRTAVSLWESGDRIPSKPVRLLLRDFFRRAEKKLKK